MTTRCWTVLLLAVSAGFAGCSATVNLVPEPLSCPLPKPEAELRCAGPMALADGATYGDIVKAGVEDRNALRVCARNTQLLVQTMTACTEATERYKLQIREINDKLGKKP
jgi:hypothetical protein